jgi:hypothetical protein
MCLAHARAPRPHVAELHRLTVPDQGRRPSPIAAPTILARGLHDAWAQAPEGDVVVRVRLFGIAHAEALEGVSLAELVAQAADRSKP